MKSNTTIYLSYCRDEVELLTILDEDRKRGHLFRSIWFKNKIREQYVKRKPSSSFVMICVSARLEKEESKMMNTILRKEPKYR